MKTTPRHFARQLLTVLLLVAATGRAQDAQPASSPGGKASTPGIPKPTPSQVVWQNCELGVIFHLDAPLVTGVYVDNNSSQKTINPKDYNPQKLDTDQWLAAAKAMGAKYAVFTATHFNGFMQWQSDLYPYGVKQAAWRDGKGDIVADFVKSCRKYGILPGIYFSTHRNVYNGVWGHYVNWGEGKGTEKQAAFNRIAEKQTEELCSRYGDLVQIWYDAGVKLPHEGGPDVLPIFDKYQPNSVFYNSSLRSDHRWVGNERGVAGDPCWATMPDAKASARLSVDRKEYLAKHLFHGDPNGTVWSPAMADTVLRGKKGHHWFWMPDTERTIHSVGELMDMYYKSVGRNANLLMGIVVNPDGLVPDPDVKRMKEFGAEIQRTFGNLVAQTKGKGKELILELPENKRTFDNVVLQEDIREGERVRRFTVEYSEGGNWKPLVKGACIGHKYIYKSNKPVKAERLRLKVAESVAEPQIENFAVYLAGRK